MSWRRFPVAWTLVSLALLLMVAWGACHGAGFREYTTILAGTLPPGVDASSAETGAVAYLLAWFGLTVGAPILLIAAGLSAALERRFAVPEPAVSD